MFAFLTTSMAILVLLAPLALAQESSPAGGGCLDSFAVCSDNDSLDRTLGDFSIEAWIYPKRKPKRDEWWIIAAKPDSYELAFVGPNDEMRNTHIADLGIVFRVYYDDIAPKDLVSDRYIWVAAYKDNPTIIWWPPDGFEFNKWHRIVARFYKNVEYEWQGKKKGADASIYIDGVFTASSLAGKVWRPPDTGSPFYVGGIENRRGSYFDGYIDELRISNVIHPILVDIANLDTSLNFLFDRDRKTLGLWRFDEPEGATLFHDSSGNGNILRKGGLSVASAGKLAATWAGVKSGR
jgi:hypothetical protein